MPGRATGVLLGLLALATAAGCAASGTTAASTDSGARESGSAVDSGRHVTDAASRDAGRVASRDGRAETGVDASVAALDAAGDSLLPRDGASVDALSACAPNCLDGAACALGDDCASGVCTLGSCAPPACSPSCVDGARCAVATDCASGVCTANECAPPACSPSCVDGSLCGAGTDCGSAVCTNGTCATPACAPACIAGSPCGANVDCASTVCSRGACVDPTSCLTLQASNTMAASGVYAIDPDGPGGLAPFDVYCDMTTSGGGWTVLPLLFDNPSYWSITHPGPSCVTIDVQDDGGDYRQYQSSSAAAFSQTYMQFVPPIPVTAVQFVDFAYSNSGSANSMDFVLDGLPTSMQQSYEAWYFVDAGLTPVGYVFSTQAQCLAAGGSYVYSVGPPAYCTRDTLGPPIPVALFDLNETLSLSATVPTFNMALVQGCSSNLAPQVNEGEQFHIATPPNASGVWQAGIEVR